MTERYSKLIAVQCLTLLFASWGASPLRAQTPAALTGKVSSKEEGLMEGVLVRAKREGSTVTVTVASDAAGQYSFPRVRLQPGRYTLTIRAVGYELADPVSAELTAQNTAVVDLKLSKAKDLAYQLSNAEWMMSMPGTHNQKEALLLIDCIECHTMERTVRSRYNAKEFLQVIRRMNTYGPASIPLHLELNPPSLAGARGAENQSPQLELHAKGHPVIGAQVAEYLSSVNLSASSTWKYPLQTLPRPKGKGTRAIITEYDLPRPDIQPHDVVSDPRGLVWYIDWTDPILGMLDPKSGKVTEYPIPELIPGSPAKTHDLNLDSEGNVWLSMGDGGKIGMFDPKTQKFQVWRQNGEGSKAGISFVAGQYRHVDGKVWGLDAAGIDRQGALHQLDVRSGEMKYMNLFQSIPKGSVDATRSHRVYGFAADSKNNIYALDYGSEYIVKVEGKTGKETLYRTPTLNSAPRRGNMDSHDRLAFAEFLSDQVGIFDTRTEQFQEFKIPTPWSGPYDAALDKNGYVWAGGMTTDRVTRINVKTGEIVEYLLPRFTNIRRVDVDNSTNPVAFWVGNNHGASIIKLEVPE